MSPIFRRLAYELVHLWFGFALADQVHALAVTRVTFLTHEQLRQRNDAWLHSTERVKCHEVARSIEKYFLNLNWFCLKVLKRSCILRYFRSFIVISDWHTAVSYRWYGLNWNMFTNCQGCLYKHTNILTSVSHFKKRFKSKLCRWLLCEGHM